ncbi:hypothetical protein [Pseudorhizobium flavum]|uniref:hypothetical protein n=1 Tax=Pseudorhizobium flavum TaxID=1335061 RepID=UPI00376FEE4B
MSTKRSSNSVEEGKSATLLGPSLTEADTLFETASVDQAAAAEAPGADEISQGKTPLDGAPLLSQSENPDGDGQEARDFDGALLGRGRTVHHNTTEAGRASMRGRRSASSKRDGIAEGASSVASSLDEVIALDHEIQALRAVLAAKLELQNLQLKKMLERFDC